MLIISSQVVLLLDYARWLPSSYIIRQVVLPATTSTYALLCNYVCLVVY